MNGAAWRLFLGLYACTALGIFLHEVGHHLLGLPSELSLARNWPLVAVTPGNQATAALGSLSGPGVNLALAWAAMLLPRRPARAARRAGAVAGLYVGLANAFLVVSATLINLAADAISAHPGNDLQVASHLLGLPWLVLPALYVGLGLPPLVRYWRQAAAAVPGRAWRAVLVLAAYLLAGITLLLLDSLTGLRFRIV